MKRSKLNSSEKYYAFAMVGPVVLGFLSLLAFPLIYEFYLSLTDTQLVGTARFIGFENYKTLFTNDPVFVKSMGNSLYFTAALVPLNISIAVLLACMLNNKLHGIGIFRTLIFMPNITPVVVWALVWKYILATDVGVINGFLQSFGIQGPAWLYSMSLTMPVMIINAVMKGVGLNMVIILSALKSIPDVYYEAARIDGASPVKTFWHITIPMLSPILFMVTIMTIIGALKMFSLIYVFTGGGPARSTQLIVLYIFIKAFKEYQFGYAAAIAVLFFILILCLTLVQWTFRRRFVYAED
ncbi:sugar ABC transporter permease [Treponema sp. OttesenSCG-928-L16]|nr:sugar ABC transporter permease [Treponema sp. OttesenSCG-928-L16]